jgi:hypothetical protein
MRMLKLSGKLDLAAESITIDPSRKVGRQHLHDNGAAKSPILRHKDATHATAQKLALELIASAQCVLKMLGEVRHETIGDSRDAANVAGDALTLMIRLQTSIRSDSRDGEKVRSDCRRDSFW